MGTGAADPCASGPRFCASSCATRSHPHPAPPRPGSGSPCRNRNDPAVSLIGGQLALDKAVPRRYRPALHLPTDRKSTRLNSSHLGISYAVFCLKKKKDKKQDTCTQNKSTY